MYHVDITNSGEYVFNVKSKDYECVVDVKGKGMTPPDTLLASIGTCIGVYLRKYAENVKLELPAFKIKVDADFCKEPPICFRKIEVSIDLQGVALDERRAKGMIEFLKNCPVHNTIKNNPEVVIKVA